MRHVIPIAFLSLSIFHAAAWGYGGGGGSASCAEPKFFDPNPAGAVPSLSEFAFTASDNADSPTLTVDINGQKTPVKLERMANGEWKVKATPPAPIAQPGKAIVGVNAKSLEGCWGFKAFFVEIKP
jgi:hypothetical protein